MIATKTLTLTVDSPEVAEATTQAEQMMTRYSTFQIKAQPDYDEAGELLKKIKVKAAEIEELQKGITRPLNEALKRARDLFRRPLDYLERAENSLRKVRLIWQNDQEAKRLEAESKLRELARKEEEKKRKALEVRIEKAEEKGDTEKAELLREKQAEVFVPAPIVESQVQKTEGIGIRKMWKFRIADESLIPREYLIPDSVKIGKMVRASGGTVKIAGVEVFSEDVEMIGGK